MTAVFLEQTAIALTKEWGFEEVRAPNWFEIDEPSIKAIIQAIDELNDTLRQWSMRNRGESCFVPLLDVPYGRYIRQHRAYKGLRYPTGELAETVVKFNEQEDTRLNARRRELRIQAQARPAVTG